MKMFELFSLLYLLNLFNLMLLLLMIKNITTPLTYAILNSNPGLEGVGLESRCTITLDNEHHH
jgi:hypothetical protein